LKQIQAIEYVLDGERIVSCGTNILKVRVLSRTLISLLMYAGLAWLSRIAKHPTLLYYQTVSLS
jgi:hypothetical protein